METTFRWRNWLGASVIFFLIFGVINVGLAIAVPATLHLNGSFPALSSVLETHNYWAARLLACAMTTPSLTCSWWTP